MRTTSQPSRNLLRADDGVAAIEAALVFPVLLLLLMGTYDLGNAILANMKTVRASQVVADLVSRTRSVTTADINEAIEAGRLALQPMNTSSYGVDIVSIRFDNDGDASIAWRETRNMTADAGVMNRVAPLRDENSGVIVVIAKYDFQPFFASFIAEDIEMSEIAFTRGRKSAVVERR